MNRPAETERARLLLRLLMALLATFLVLAPAPAVLAADEEEEESIETKFIKALLGISNQDSIDYRERPPLVVPPNLDRLPAPEANALVNSPAWPKDPEVVERQKRRQAAKTQRRKSFEEEGRTLTPAELDVVGRARPGSQRPNPTGPQDAETDGARVLRPTELGSKGNLIADLFKDTSKPEQATFTREPERSSLVQPPAGYRTPSPNHPYGISPRKEKAKPYDFLNSFGTGQ